MFIYIYIWMVRRISGKALKSQTTSRNDINIYIYNMLFGWSDSELGIRDDTFSLFSVNGELQAQSKANQSRRNT